MAIDKQHLEPSKSLHNSCWNITSQLSDVWNRERWYWTKIWWSKLKQGLKRRKGEKREHVTTGRTYLSTHVTYSSETCHVYLKSLNERETTNQPFSFIFSSYSQLFSPRFSLPGSQLADICQFIPTSEWSHDKPAHFSPATSSSWRSTSANNKSCSFPCV